MLRPFKSGFCVLVKFVPLQKFSDITALCVFVDKGCGASMTET